MSTQSRIIAHVDLDYFFAQVEELLNPELVGKPVVVCVYSGRTAESGVVSSATYAARRYGVRAGMPIARAKKLLQGVEAILLPLRREVYQNFSEKVMDTLRREVDTVEVESVDEAFADGTRWTGGDWRKAFQLGQVIKARVLSETGLRCTVGIGPNKVVAKIASDSAKPDGLKIVPPSEVSSFLKPLKCEALPGVGPKLAARLASIGVKTLDQLSALEIEPLSQLVGHKTAQYLRLASRGEYEEQVKEKKERKQIGRIITLKNDTREVDEIVDQLEEPLASLAEAAARLGVVARGVGIIGITTRLETVTRARSFDTPLSFEELHEIVRTLFVSLLTELSDVVLRRAGVRLFALERPTHQTRLTAFNADKVYELG